jgi:hypothetical protein
VVLTAGADALSRLGVDQRRQHELDALADDVDVATGADLVQQLHVRLAQGHRGTPQRLDLAVKPKMTR